MKEEILSTLLLLFLLYTSSYLFWHLLNLPEVGDKIDL
jgi:hypothetical protein